MIQLEEKQEKQLERLLNDLPIKCIGIVQQIMMILNEGKKEPEKPPKKEDKS